MKRVLQCSLISLSLVVCVPAINTSAQTNPAPTSTVRDGQRDFDFEIGTWKTHLKRRLRPLTGSNEWVEYEGTRIVSRVLNGRANLVELDVNGTAGRIQGMSLRLYNPEARQWSLNFSNVRSGTLSPPVIGEFKNGRGEFYVADTLNSRGILVHVSHY